jgi:hypothetical protein
MTRGADITASRMRSAPALTAMNYIGRDSDDGC